MLLSFILDRRSQIFSRAWNLPEEDSAVQLKSAQSTRRQNGKIPERNLDWFHMTKKKKYASMHLSMQVLYSFCKVHLFWEGHNSLVQSSLRSWRFYGLGTVLPYQPINYYFLGPSTGLEHANSTQNFQAIRTPESLHVSRFSGWENQKGPMVPGLLPTGALTLWKFESGEGSNFWFFKVKR